MAAPGPVGNSDTSMRPANHPPHELSVSDAAALAQFLQDPPKIFNPTGSPLNGLMERVDSREGNLEEKRNLEKKKVDDTSMPFFRTKRKQTSEQEAQAVSTESTECNNEQEIGRPPFSLEIFYGFINEDPPKHEDALNYIKSSSPSADPMGLPSWQTAEAQCLRLSKKVDDAIAILDATVIPNIRAMVSNIDNGAEIPYYKLQEAQALVELGYCYFEKKKFEEMQAVLTTAEELFAPNSSANMVQKGSLLKLAILKTRAFQEQNQTDDALEITKSALEAAKQVGLRQEAQVHLQEKGALFELRGDLLRKNGHEEAAKKAFEEATRIYARCFHEQSPSTLRAKKKSQEE